MNHQFDPSFPFGEEVFLSDKPMADNEFALYIRSDNNEIPIEEVDFTDQWGQTRLTYQQINGVRLD